MFLPVLIALTTLIADVSAVPPSPAAPLHIPLARRASTRDRTLDDFAAAADFVRARYGFETVQSKLAKAANGGSDDAKRKRASAVTFPMTNQDSDSSYFAAIQVGTPSKSFNIILDTGSSDLWLASSNCQQCPSDVPPFNTGSSSSFSSSSSSRVSINYGSGSVSGSLGSDTVSMGDFSVKQQGLTIVTQMTSGLLAGDTSGIMGLGFQSIASSKATPFWQNLISANQLSAPEMSFWLTRFVNDQNAKTEEPGGAFTLGGMNSTLFQGDVEFLNFPSGVQPSFWLLQVNSVTVQGKTVNVNQGSGGTNLAAIDTGTTLIGGPTSAVQSIYAQIPNSEQLQGNMQGFFGFPCSTKVAVSVSFGGQSWPINPADFNLGPVDRQGSTCLGGIFDLGGGAASPIPSGNPQWVMGDTFLKNVYSVFRANPPSIGFAQLSDAAGGSSGTTASHSSLPASRASSTSFAATTIVTVTGTPIGGGGSRGSNAGNPLPTGAKTIKKLSSFVSYFAFSMLSSSSSCRVYSWPGENLFLFLSSPFV